MLDILQKYEEYYALCKPMSYNQNFMIDHKMNPIRAGTL